MLGKTLSTRTWFWGALLAMLMSSPIPLCLSAPQNPPSKQSTPSAPSASFDCAKAQSSVESLICKNPELAQLDSSMADAYRKAAKRIKPKEVVKLRQEQRRWIKQTRSLCLDATCLKQVYTDRIYILDKTKTPLSDITICPILSKWNQDKCTKMIVHRNPNEKLGYFRMYIKNGYHPWSMTDCTMLIEVPTEAKLGNTLYYGHCTLQSKLERQEILIEIETLIGGSLLVRNNGRPKDLNKLIEFINDPLEMARTQGEVESSLKVEEK